MNRWLRVAARASAADSARVMIGVLALATCAAAGGWLRFHESVFAEDPIRAYLPLVAADQSGAVPAVPTPPTLRGFQAVSSQHYHTCGLRTDATVVCWGLEQRGPTLPGGMFVQVSVGGGYALRSVIRDGRVVSFTISSHTCALRTDDTVACWGTNDEGQATPPAGTFVQVSAGDLHTCGLRTDGSVTCWGAKPASPGVSPPRTGVDQGQATPPAGSFSQVSAGYRHTCAVRLDGRVVCWGNNEFGQSTPPDGIFREISAGALQTCGLASNGAVVCWGSYWGTDGKLLAAVPPSGLFQQVSVGLKHVCGVRTDRTVACSGANDHGEATPPEGAFRHVSAGWDYTCGVRTDGRVTCWGRNEYGEATPPSP